MRPIDRGTEPRKYTNYEDAKQDLANRLGGYCSYCERKIVTNLAIEHILPKDPILGYSHLRNEWNNFLLGCVNCNSSKGNTVIGFDKYLLPDRDNTFHVFKYDENGGVTVTAGLDPLVSMMAQNTMDLVKLNHTNVLGWDETNLFAALTRINHRVAAWVLAKIAREEYENGETSLKSVCVMACENGSFSIWMDAFTGIKEVRLQLIKTFANTASDCFDADGNSVSPRPANGLQNSGKS